MQKYKLGQAIRVKEEMFTKSVMGAMVGVKLEEKKDENTGAILTQYIYSLSGHSNWFYESFLIPMVDMIREEKTVA